MLIYPPVSFFIFFLSTTISFYFLSIHLYIFISLCQSRLMPISFNSILFISAYNPHLSTCFFFISFLSTTIFFYFFFIKIYIYFFQSPYSNLSLSYTYIFFYRFGNPNLRLYHSTFFSLFQYIPHLFTSITFYRLYISLWLDLLILYILYH